MGIFEGLKRFDEQYQIVETNSFTEEDVANCSKAEVVASQYGNSVCFFMKAGGKFYIPVSDRCPSRVGDIVDLTKAKVIVLQRNTPSGISVIKRVVL